MCGNNAENRFQFEGGYKLITWTVYFHTCHVYIYIK